MARANASTGIAMEVLVKKDETVPVGIVLELRSFSIHRPLALLVAHENLRQPTRKLCRDLPEGHHVPRARWKLNFEVVAQVVVKSLQRFDQEKVDRKPDGTTPVGIPAE